MARALIMRVATRTRCQTRVLTRCTPSGSSTRSRWLLTGDPGSDVAVSATVPTRDGYTFTGWNTAEDGSGTNYSGGDTVTLPNSGTDTLYAQWQINTVTLTYDPQGGSGEPGDQSGDAASDV